MSAYLQAPQAVGPSAPAIPQAPAAPAAAQGGDLAAMRTQLGDLRVELAGLNAQWEGLKSQLDQMLRNNPARPGVQQKWADVGIQKATIEGKIATLEARIAQRQGLPVGTPRIPTIPPIPRFGNQNFVLPVVSVVALALMFPISVAWAKRIVRRSPRPTPIPNDLTIRLDRIEQAVDTIAIEVERISEGQRFVTKIMAERPSSAGEGQASRSAVQERQPLALGAGPIEPVIVSERDRAYQRVVTPH